jgi:hypothetical protein
LQGLFYAGRLGGEIYPPVFSPDHGSQDRLGTSTSKSWVTKVTVCVFSVLQEQQVNTIFPLDTFCSCYSCNWTEHHNPQVRKRHFRVILY